MFWSLFGVFEDDCLGFGGAGFFTESATDAEIGIHGWEFETSSASFQGNGAGGAGKGALSAVFAFLGDDAVSGEVAGDLALVGSDTFAIRECLFLDGSDTDCLSCFGALVGACATADAEVWRETWEVPSVGAFQGSEGLGGAGGYAMCAGCLVVLVEQEAGGGFKLNHGDFCALLCGERKRADGAGGTCLRAGVAVEIAEIALQVQCDEIVLGWDDDFLRAAVDAEMAAGATVGEALWGAGARREKVRVRGKRFGRRALGAFCQGGAGSKSGGNETGVCDEVASSF